MTDYQTHPQYRALHAAVCAAPEDDLPRLVLADWLEEHGEHERAEFIRLQAALAANERGKRGKTRRRELQRRINHFMRGTVTLRRYPWFNEVLDDWKLELKVDGWKYVVGGAYGRGVTFRRGFISEVRCTLAAWCGGECGLCDGLGTVPHDFPRSVVDGQCPECSGTGRTHGIGPRLVREHPIERVTLTDPPPVEFLPDGSGRWSINGRLDIGGGGTLCPTAHIAFPSVEEARTAWEDWLSDTLVWWAKAASLSPTE